MFSKWARPVLLEEVEEHTRQIALMKWLARQAKKHKIGDHVYVVGGAVRNFIIDQPIKDIDMMIDSVAAGGRDSEWLAKKLQKAIPTRSNLTTNQYGVAIITVKGDWMIDGANLDGEVIEIANARKESYGGSGGKGYKPSGVEKATAEQDVVRREFTFNTLMWRLSELASGPDKAEIIDLTGCGLRDLKAGIMRCPSNPDKTFADDPTRMLRAIKFLMKYGFKIDKETERSIRRNAPKIHHAPWEAISGLLLDVILKDPKTAKKALKEMDRLGLLDEVSKMIQGNSAFASRLAGWAADKRVMYLFDLLDMGIPAGARLSFLSPKDQKKLRQVAATMPEGEAERFLDALKQPGKAIANKQFIPTLVRERGLSGKAMGLFANQVSEKARRLLLDEPELMQNSRALQARLRAGVSESLLVTRIDELLG